MIVQHTNTKTAKIHLKYNKFQLFMKLLTTSSADIIQECRVMFDAKSVSKSIFKCRRNVLPVVVDFKMANIRGIKSNNDGLMF